MEFSSEVSEGLQLAGDSAHIPDSLFSNVVKLTYESLLHKEKRNNILEDQSLAAIDKAVLKQSHAALATLFLEAAKHDRDPASISPILEDSKFSPERIREFNNIFTETKPHIQAALSGTGTNPPHIVDVDWRLDYYIKDNHTEKINEAVYLVNLKTEECGNPEMKNVQFVCTQDQLQDLVGKLKDACKSLERASQM